MRYFIGGFLLLMVVVWSMNAGAWREKGRWEKACIVRCHPYQMESVEPETGCVCADGRLPEPPNAEEGRDG